MFRGVKKFRNEIAGMSSNESTAFYPLTAMPAPDATVPPLPHDESHRTVENVLEHEKEIDRKLESQQALKSLLERAKLLLSMVRDYATGRYREVPYWVIGAAAFALLYVLSPVDLIPDLIPGIGYLDDAAVVALCLKMIETEFAKYREWKRMREVEAVVVA
jgi:uncharacterized membrane protein YkvA (DUF1232 family)